MTKHYLRAISTIAGILGIVLVAALLLSISTPGHSQAASLAPVTAAPAQATDTGADAPIYHQPNQPYAANVVNSTLLDWQLPGTQPGGLTDPLSDSSSCTGCHVDHFRDNFNGSMMTNGVRDPLFRAALVIANADAGFGGELCIRCHTPDAWLNGRSANAADPASTDGRFIDAQDLHGISCTACHRMVPPTPLEGEATIDAGERAALTGPFMTGNGAYIIDRLNTRRGPFDIASAPHPVAESTYLRSAQLCATCHDIDNPLLTFDNTSNEFRLNPLNTPAAVGDRLFPLDRSYSEWAMSDFANGGVTGLDYPGLKRSNGATSGPITVCQDCHMPMVSAKLATAPDTLPLRTVGKHQWVGASTTWQDGITQVWDGVAADTRFDAAQTALNKTLATEFLKLAADLDVSIVNDQIEVKVTNNTGHKLPTGYAEGRRMWIEVYQLNGSTAVFTSGLLAGVVGPLIEDPYLKKYETKLGLTDAHAQEIGRPELAGEGFHIILNNKVFKDNRIPPRGFTNANFATRDMQPVGATYADGQYWDTTYYPLHPEATYISVRLMYQTATTEYLDFLATNADFDVADTVRGPTNWGQLITNLRAMDIGKPVAMTAKSIALPRQYVATTGTDTGLCDDAAQPCQTISYALTKAVPGGEIRVAAGTYPEQILITTHISLTGGFTLSNWITPTWTTNVTVLDGQNTHRPLTINADGVRVNGFTIRNGNATSSALGARNGGGIYIGGVNIVEQRATLLNLRIENNIASTLDEGQGGGLYAEIGNTFNNPAQLTLTNVTVTGNSATTGNLGARGGGMDIHAAGNSMLNVDMVNVTVEGNTAGNDFSSVGGGIAFGLNGGTATLRQSRILGNHAAQIPTILGGPSRGGGLYLTDGELALINVLIARNDGERGDGIAVVGGATGAVVAMNYVTIADNYRQAEDAAAAIHSDGPDSYFILANTLISGNPVAFEGLSNAQPPELQLDSVLVDDNVGTAISGTIVITGTPLRGSAAYVNGAAGDYHLTAASDAIDQGNDQPPPIDLDGNIRPQGAGTDIGAYEFTPAGLNNQTITFGPLDNKELADPPFSITATASSGLPVTFTSLTTSVCTVSGNTVTLVNTGTCTIEANQPGNASFNPAPPVAQSFAVTTTTKSNQTITFAKPADKVLGDPPFTLAASASSGLPVSFVSNTPAICTISGSTVTLLAVGACSITATQDGNAAFNPATPVTQSFNITTQGGGGTTQKLYMPTVQGD